MGTQETTTQKREFDWRKWSFQAAGFGVGFALVLALIVVCAFWYSSRRKGWNSDAVKGISSNVGQILDDQGNATGFYLSFIVENNSGKDYTLPQSLKFFKRGQKSQALEETTITLDHAFSVPAKERAEIRANMQYSCRTIDEAGRTSERKGEICFQEAFGDASEFVAYDFGSRIRLDLPKPVFYIGAESKPGTANNAIAPDNAAPWDKYWACSEAKRLTPICKQSNIELDQARVSADGWTPVGALPTLPRPPKGFLLEPSAETCRIVYQWDYYCHRKGITR